MDPDFSVLLDPSAPDPKPNPTASDILCGAADTGSNSKNNNTAIIASVVSVVGAAAIVVSFIILIL